MTRDDAAIFADEIAKTAELFGQALSEMRVTAYFEALADMEIEHVVGGLMYCRSHSRFFPSPGEVREQSAGGPLEEQALRIWSEIAAANKSFRLEDPAAAMALDAVGGWVTILEGAASRFSQFSAVFVRTYCAVVRDEERDDIQQKALQAVSSKALPR